MTIERKILTFKAEEVDEEEGTFTGYAATFSKVPDSYGDIIDQGAFANTLKAQAGQIVSLFNHSIMDPIGKPTAMKEDDKGLLINVKLSLGVQRAREVLSLMKDGVITQMSIGYETIKQTYNEGIRHLKEVKLYDVSPVVFAANTEAVIIGVKLEELKPYPNEHACRIRAPGDFESDSFRRTNRESDDKKYIVIMGKLEGEDSMTEQAYRYDRTIWDEEDAKAHCKKYDGTFEAAKEDTFKCECVDCGKKVDSKKHCSDIECPECGGKMRREERPGPGKTDGKSLTFADQAEAVLATVTEWIDRTKSLADLRLKEGRVLSTVNRKRLASLLEALGKMASDINELLEATQPGDDEKMASLAALVDGMKAENEGFNIKQAEGRIEAILEQIRE